MTHKSRSPVRRLRTPRPPGREGCQEPQGLSPQAGRTADGRFARGNTGALRHGTRSRHVGTAALPAQVAVRANLAAKRAGIVADLGGEERLGQLQQDLIDRYLELDTVAAWLGGHLVARGVLTPTGRSRAALRAYLQVLDRQHRLATALGLRRQARSVPTLDEVLDAE